MSQTVRHQRLRLLLKQLNRQRKQQARQIDILCNDLIGAQRSFLGRLQDLRFAAEFYRSLLGSTDLNSLLTRAGRALRQELPGTGVVFFLRQADGCEIHACPDQQSLLTDTPEPQDGFDPELVHSICKHNQPCARDDLVALGLDRHADGLSRVSLVTLPLSDLGRSLGFVLLYCPLPQVLTVAEVRRIRPVLCPLVQAIRARRVPLASRE
jgi:hypothetical protein